MKPARTGIPGAKGPAHEVPKRGAESNTSAALTQTTPNPRMDARRTSSPAAAYNLPSSYHRPKVSSPGVGEDRTC